ncbi:hypothetical protein H6P81_005961 [Aristolochia fimbriata]|uniref:Uncharacterized protein n=1 Tax=Aristolochia fimbriata TaxID=158543 RepID=A0AAV7EZH2_ARIFI|nr:hypothetical protein H6P81_005961 [Aristolochia fimbriata]
MLKEFCKVKNTIWLDPTTKGNLVDLIKECLYQSVLSVERFNWKEYASMGCKHQKQLFLCLVLLFSCVCD